MEQPTNVTTDNMVVVQFKLNMAWKNVYADLSNPVTQGMKVDVENFVSMI